VGFVLCMSVDKACVYEVQFVHIKYIKSTLHKGGRQYGAHTKIAILRRPAMELDKKIYRLYTKELNVPASGINFMPDTGKGTNFSPQASLCPEIYDLALYK